MRQLCAIQPTVKLSPEFNNVSCGSNKIASVHDAHDKFHQIKLILYWCNIIPALQDAHEELHVV